MARRRGNFIKRNIFRQQIDDVQTDNLIMLDNNLNPAQQNKFIDRLIIYLFNSFNLFE